MNLEKITNKIIQLDEYLGILKQIGKTDKDAFIRDNILIGSAKYYLQVSIEVCLGCSQSHYCLRTSSRPKGLCGLLYSFE